MKIVGELNRSFGNFLSLRGVASMKELANISLADKGYQRDLLERHGAAMQDFLNKGEYTFFPELIFSTTLDDDSEENIKARELYEAVPHQSFRKTKFRNFTLKATTRKSKSVKDLREALYFCQGEFETTDDKNKILQRIDGNHRLSATEDLDKDLQVPFCIIFYADQSKADKFNRVLFSNINYKSLPLTQEKNLHIIFEKQEGKYLFTDDELEDPVWFGEDYITARNLYHQLSLENLDHIQTILQKENKDIYTRTFLLLLVKIYKKGITPKSLKKALQQINTCYATYHGYKNSYQLLVTHGYYYFLDQLDIFSKWVVDNHIYELEETESKGIIAIFNKILNAKKRTIFLAMSFDDKAQENHDAIKDAIEEINSQCSTDLKLKLMRIDEIKIGHSSAIIDQILKNIEEGGYLIADISLANPNVYYELGYQMGLNKGKEQKQDNFLLVHNKGVANADFEKDKSFNISHIGIETANNRNELREKVKVQLKRHYRLLND